MNNETPAPERKGLHPLAWVGIGCGVVILIVIISMGALTWWGWSKAKEAGLDPASIKNNPVLAAARVALIANPDLEVVEADPETEIITIRNKKTGELITVNYEDLKEGRFSWTGDDGKEVSVDVSGAENGTVRIERSDGDGFELTTGAAVSDEIPEWVPVYPGSEPENRGTMKTADSVNGNFTLKTDDSVPDVVAYFRDELKETGFEVSVNTYSGEGAEGALLNGSMEAEERNVVVVIGTTDGATTVSVTYTSKK